jgi:hypothetical protein
MFRLSLQGPFRRPQGRQSVTSYRPTLEPLEDRSLLSVTGVSPFPGLPLSGPANTNPAITGGPQPSAPSGTGAGSAGTTNPQSPQFQQAQTPANNVGSPSQVIQTLSVQQESAFTVRSGLLQPSGSVGLPNTPGLNTYQTFSFTNQSLNSSAAGSPLVALQTYSPGSPTGFQGYLLYPNTGVSARTALPAGPMQEQPGLLLPGGGGGGTLQEQIQPPKARPVPPPPPPAQPSPARPSASLDDEATPVTGQTRLNVPEDKTTAPDDAETAHLAAIDSALTESAARFDDNAVPDAGDADLPLPFDLFYE